MVSQCLADADNFLTFLLGGQNAFNYVSLIMATLTLVVNVNNNINNNNNNLNQFSGNVVGNNNANANTNNNNGNVVNVMPPGKKKRRRKRSLKNYSNSTMCNESEKQMSINSYLGNASMATLKLVQVIMGLIRFYVVIYLHNNIRICPSLRWPLPSTIGVPYCPNLQFL